MYTYIYIHIHIDMFVCVYIYIYLSLSILKVPPKSETVWEFRILAMECRAGAAYLRKGWPGAPARILVSSDLSPGSTV